MWDKFSKRLGLDTCPHLVKDVAWLICVVGHYDLSNSRWRMAAISYRRKAKHAGQTPAFTKLAGVYLKGPIPSRVTEKEGQEWEDLQEIVK